MTELPDPTIPGDIDLRDFPYMPLHVHRLQRSKAWLMCKRDPALAFYMMNLWMRAWHEVPSGSVEDDDDVLADAAMCDIKLWPKVKERVLHGWVSKDGRLCHPVVTEIAATSWSGKQKQRQRTEAARQALSQKVAKPATATTQPPIEPATVPVTAPVTEPVTAPVTGADTENVTASKYKGESKGEGKGERKQATPPESPPSRARGGTRGRRLPRGSLPDEWLPSAQGIAFAAEKGAPADKGAIEAFRNYHQAHGSVMADWDAAWRTWCGYARRMGHGVQGEFPGDDAIDPWGLNAWIKHQPDAKDAVAGKENRPCKAIKGISIQHSAECLAEAAGLPPSWRGNWDALGKWLRDDIDVSELPVLDAVRAQASRMNGGIGTMKVFDAVVSSARNGRMRR